MSNDLYGGRSFPHGRVRDGSHHRVESEPPLEPKRGGAFNSNVVQDPENKHDVKYDNDTSGWVHGAGEAATTKPSFDKGRAWRQSGGTAGPSRSRPVHTTSELEVRP